MYLTSLQYKHVPFSGKPLMLQAFYHAISDAVITTDAQFVITSWNKGAEEILGYSEAVMVGRQGDVEFVFDHLSSSHEEASLAILEHGTWRGSVRLKHRDGQVVYLDAHVTLVRNHQGEPEGYVAVCRDITKAYNQGKILDNYVAILKAMEESFLVVDPQYKVVLSHFKSPLDKYFSVVPPVGASVINSIPAHRKEFVAQKLAEAFAGQPVRYDFNLPDLPNVHMDFQYMGLTSGTDLVEHVCIVVRDVSSAKNLKMIEEAQRHAEAELHRNRKFFELFMENAPMPSWITDLKGTMRYMNPAYLKIYGYDLSLGDKTIYELFSKESANQFAENNRRVVASRQPLITVEEATVPNGPCEVYKVIKFPIEYQGEWMAAGWAMNISDQVRLQELMVQLEKDKNTKMVQSIIHTIETERGALAVTLRDSINQNLAACKLLLEAEANDRNPFVNRANNYIQQSISELKIISDNLNPHTVEDLGFKAAICQLAGRFSKQVQLHFELTAEEESALSPQLCLGIYRILQSLLPIIPPSSSSYNKVVVERKDTQLQLTCVGFGLLQASTQMGTYEWKSVLSRIAFLDGSYEVSESFTLIRMPL